jgi:predicted cupin superfamily sugar epimerase
VTEAAALIDQLGLIPHPEGGWYRETWRAPAASGDRAAGTLIHFLLETGQRSHWHRVDADEIWLWQGGDALELAIAADQVLRVVLGADQAEGNCLQAVVPAGFWQAATPLIGGHGYALVSCVVVPGFEFAGFELAAPGWEPAISS